MTDPTTTPAAVADLANIIEGVRRGAWCCCPPSFPRCANDHDWSCRSKDALLSAASRGSAPPVVSKPTLAEVRRAVADYISSEGCSCCRSEQHDEHLDRLGKMLRVPKYEDGSGRDFYQYRSFAQSSPAKGNA